VETLAEGVHGVIADNAAAQLPHEVGEHLHRGATWPEGAAAERLELEEFVRRVSERSGLSPSQAPAAGAVLEVVGKATADVMPNIDQSLPSVKKLVGRLRPGGP
jgi:uncharacterized protein (DUF2267 family)